MKFIGGNDFYEEGYFKHNHLHVYIKGVGATLKPHIFSLVYTPMDVMM